MHKKCTSVLKLKHGLQPSYLEKTFSSQGWVCREHELVWQMSEVSAQSLSAITTCKSTEEIREPG